MFLTDLADNLKAYQASDGTRLRVVETPGWKARGHDGRSLVSVDGHMFHHTASNQSSGLDVVTLNLCMYGRSDLPGPLCHLMLGRSGAVYVVAAGLANHAGTGHLGGAYRNVGNYYFIGTEMESSGVRNDWTPEQLHMMKHLGAALELAYGPADGSFIQVGHKEYSDIGKIDPNFVEMSLLRDAINIETAGGVAGDWFDMATKEDLENVVFNTRRPEFGGRTLAQTLNEIDKNNWAGLRMTRHLFNLFRLGIPGVVSDGTFGAKLREIFGYREDSQGRARRAEYDADSKNAFRW